MRWLLILGLGLLACGGSKGTGYVPEDGRIYIWNALGPPTPAYPNIVVATYFDEDLSTDVITEVPPGEKRPLGADRPEYGSEGKLFKGGTVVPVRIRVRVSGEVKVDGNRTIKVLPPLPESGSLLYELH